MKHETITAEAGQFQYVEIDGVNIRVFTRSLDRAETPLLICNGLGQAVEMLFPLMEELPDRPIISFDAAGVGRSDVPENAMSISHHASLVARIMHELGIRTYDILGISWGGSVAQQMAHDFPDECRRLVLAITSAGGIGSWWGTPVAMSEILFPMRYSSKAYGNLIGPLMYGGEAVLQPALFREYSRNAIAPSLKGYYAQVQAMCNWSSLPWLGSLTQPTQIIAGTLDGLIPIGNQILLASQIPGAKLEVYQAGHLLMYSRRQDVGRLISEFLA